MTETAAEIGKALVLLAVVFLAAAIIRSRVTPLRRLHIPTAVVGGFLMLAVGPQGLGRLTDGSGLFPAETLAVWKMLPMLLINVMSASLLLGERLPAPKRIWQTSGPHVIMAGVMSFGQFAVGSLVVLLLLAPVFGVNPKAGALIELSFAGGHGTLAGLTPVLIKYDAEELLEVGLGLATIGMVTGVVIGTLLVRHAIKSPSISLARQRPLSADDDLDIDHHLPRPGQAPVDQQRAPLQLTTAVVAVGLAIFVGALLLKLAQIVFGFFGSAFFEKFPLFPFAIIGGVLVQLAAIRLGVASAINRRAVEGIGGLAIDGIILCAIGTLSLEALGAAVAPLVALAIASVAWSVFVTLVFGPRMFKEDWFEHAIAEFGESQGNVATGFMMVDMVDPERRTGVVLGYSYRQLLTRPVLGGGFLSALAIPLIASWGLPIFTGVTVAATVGLAFLGLRQSRRAAALRSSHDRAMARAGPA